MNPSDTRGAPSKTPGPPGARDGVVFFDSACALCHAVVGWLARSDATGKLSFVSLWAPEARELLPAVRNPGQGGACHPGAADAIALVQGGRVRFGWAAAAAVLRLLPFPHSIPGYLMALVPRPLGMAAYRYVAKRRHLWCGSAASGRDCADGAAKE